MGIQTALGVRQIIEMEYMLKGQEQGDSKFMHVKREISNVRIRNKKYCKMCVKANAQRLSSKILHTQEYSEYEYRRGNNRIIGTQQRIDTKGCAMG